MAATAILEELTTVESKTLNKIYRRYVYMERLVQKLQYSVELCSFIHLNSYAPLCTSQSTFLDMLSYSSASIQLLLFRLTQSLVDTKQYICHRISYFDFNSALELPQFCSWFCYCLTGSAQGPIYIVCHQVSRIQCQCYHRKQYFSKLIIAVTSVSSDV